MLTTVPDPVVDCDAPCGGSAVVTPAAIPVAVGPPPPDNVAPFIVVLDSVVVVDSVTVVVLVAPIKSPAYPWFPTAKGTGPDEAVW